MFSAVQKTLAYVRYRFRSVSRHGVHSPFLFDMVENVFRGTDGRIDELEVIRRSLLRDKRELVVKDLGAGTSTGKDLRMVRNIAKRSLSSLEQCSMLYRMVKHLQIEHVLEFGTSLGISSAYMAKAGAKVITMEGSQSIHGLAKEKFGRFGADLRLGPFEEILPDILTAMPRLDMAFVDGNHRKLPTLNYFEALLQHVHHDSVLIFDDIHWSDEMEQAWIAIKEHDRVTLSVDIFWCGIVFFKPGLSGEHFTIRY